MPVYNNLGRIGQSMSTRTITFGKPSQYAPQPPDYWYYDETIKNGNRWHHNGIGTALVMLVSNEKSLFSSSISVYKNYLTGDKITGTVSSILAAQKSILRNMSNENYNKYLIKKNGGTIQLANNAPRNVIVHTHTSTSDYNYVFEDVACVFTYAGSKYFIPSQINTDPIPKTKNYFYYCIGVFDANGKWVADNNKYALICWTSSLGTKVIKLGTYSELREYITGESFSKNTSYAGKNWFVVQLTGTRDKSTLGFYKYIYNGGTYIAPHNGGELVQLFTTYSEAPGVPTNSYENTYSNSSGGGGNYATEAYTETVAGYTDPLGEANSAIGVKAQIYFKLEDFKTGQLFFVPGEDKRTGFSAVEKSAIADQDNLIIKTQITSVGVNDSAKIAENNYFLYYSDDTNQTFMEQDTFFNELDTYLDLNNSLNEKTDLNSCWNGGSPPMIKGRDDGNRALLPLTCLIIHSHDYYNFDFNGEDKDIDLVSVLNRLENNPITLKDYFSDINKNYRMLFFNIEKNENGYTAIINQTINFQKFLEEINKVLMYTEKKTYSANISLIQEPNILNLYELKLLEAYTRGHDFIQESYTTVRPQEVDENGNRLMKFDENYFTYKYSGRNFNLADSDFFISQGIPCAAVHETDLLLEEDVTLGEAYGITNYFIEAIKYDTNKSKNPTIVNNPTYNYLDTFKVKDYLKAIGNENYTEDDYEIVTAKIDLDRCPYYRPLEATVDNYWCDCCYDSVDGLSHKECLYQKTGKCPYRFQTEKHPRRIRTLSQSKSNRFNLIQELSKVFEVYPIFYVEYEENGKVKLNDNGQMLKHIFFMTEKGNIQKMGFRYEKNLSNISRTVDSSSLTTKLYVEAVDSNFSDSGLCAIEDAVDNIGKDNYILNFDYYIKKGIINKEQVHRDLYGIEQGDMAFLPTIGYYNQRYDALSRMIINMTGETMTELQAKAIVAVEGVGAALEERQKVAQTMYQFKIRQQANTDKEYDYTTSDTYQNYLKKYHEQATILWGNIEQLLFTKDYYCLISSGENAKYIFTPAQYGAIPAGGANENQIRYVSAYQNKYCKGELFWRLIIGGFEEYDQIENHRYTPPFTSWIDFKEKIVDTYLYPTNGLLGQYKGFNDQVNTWKKERAAWLNKKQKKVDAFYKIYEPFIKEGTWTDSNYLTSNEYYWAGESVLQDSSKPDLSYTINVIDLAPLEEYRDDYLFELADTTFIEDIDFFGVNQITGLPNQEKVIISEINYSLDTPQENSITVQNYKTQFEDLFGAISASVQSLTFNENTYKRAANFTATKYVEKEALQGTLDEGDLILMNANKDNIVIDENGTAGADIANTASKYKLTGQGLFFSTDGGETWDVGVGPKGINADYIKFGQLDASKIQIVDGQYIYFLWDKDGITAYRNPSTSTEGLVDFARFNKYGLSLIEKGNVRLRAGYAFRNVEQGAGDNISGDYSTEVEITNQRVGFYLYNDNGQPIFKTETQSDYENQTGDYSARLSLKGEIFATNKTLSSENSGSTIGRIPILSYDNGYSIINDIAAVKLTNQTDTNLQTIIFKSSDTEGINIMIFADVQGKPYTDEEGDIEANSIGGESTSQIIDGNTTLLFGLDSVASEINVIQQYAIDENGILLRNGIKGNTYTYQRYYITLEQIKNYGIYEESENPEELNEYENIYNNIVNDLNAKDPTFASNLYEKIKEDETVIPINDMIGLYQISDDKATYLAIVDSSEDPGNNNPENDEDEELQEVTIEDVGDVYEEKERDVTIIDLYKQTLQGVGVNIDNFINAFIGTSTTINVLTGKGTGQNLKVTEKSSPVEVTYYDVSQLGTKDVAQITETTNSLYEVLDGSSTYNYWGSLSATGEYEMTSTSVATKQVGIFINNKASANGGSDLIANDISEVDLTYVQSSAGGASTSVTTSSQIPAVVYAAAQVAMGYGNKVGRDNMIWSNSSVDITTPDGKNLSLRQDCSGFMTALIRYMGYDTEVYTLKYGTGKNVIKKNGEIVSSDDGKKEWLIDPDYSGEAQPGDIFIQNYGSHADMYVYTDSSNKLKGFNGGSADGWKKSYDFAQKILNDGYESAKSAEFGASPISPSNRGELIRYLGDSSSSSPSSQPTVEQDISPLKSDTFYIIGDDLVAGLASSNSTYKNKYLGRGINIYQNDIIADSVTSFLNSTTSDNITLKEMLKGTTELGFLFGTFNSTVATDYKKLYTDLIKEFVKQLDKDLTIYIFPAIENVSQEGTDDPVHLLNDAAKGIDSSITIDSHVATIKTELLNITSLQTLLNNYSAQKNNLTTKENTDIAKIYEDNFNNKYSSNSSNASTISANGEELNGDRQTVLTGSERLFMISLLGESDTQNYSYQNIITVTKSGVLYMGGQVYDYYGQDIPNKEENFEFLPDEITIKNAPFILTNNGRIWMDFNNLLMINQAGELTDVSLMDLLSNLSSASGSGTGSGNRVQNLPAGYYLIDPISD